MDLKRIFCIVISLAFLVMLCSPTAVFAQTDKYSTGPEPIGTWTPENSLDVVVDVYASGNYAYLTVWGFGIQVLDISDPTNPVEKGTWESGRVVEVSSICYANNKIYAGVGSPSALLIFDASDPTNLSSPVTEITQWSSLYDIKVVDEYIYIADHSGSLMIANHSQNLYPHAHGYWTTNDYWCFDLVVDGDYVYSATSSKGLAIWNVSDRTHPVKVSNKAVSGANLYTIAKISANKLILGGYAGYFGIFDITDKNNPSVSGSIDITSDPGKGRGVVISGNYAFVADYTDGIVTLGVSGSSPTQNTILASPGGSTGGDRGYAVHVAGGLVYGAMGFSGLMIWNLSKSTTSVDGGLGDIPGFTIVFTIIAFLATIVLLKSKKIEFF